tara:strand:+ start:302 stop:544 length:243 start_codon:yes stop_codon:yes gene_type:complete
VAEQEQLITQLVLVVEEEFLELVPAELRLLVLDLVVRREIMVIMQQVDGQDVALYLPAHVMLAAVVELVVLVDQLMVVMV